jgi:hypothetical protein
MPRGGHNRKGNGIVEGTRAIDVMALERCGYLSGPRLGSLQWASRDGSTASVLVAGGRDAVRLDYRVRLLGDAWRPVCQRIPIRWTPCHFGGQRPWFVCAGSANGIYCGRYVMKLYGGGRLFACRHCYCLGYAVQRGGLMDRAHHHLARLHRKLGADYSNPDMSTPSKPKWMRWKTYSRIARQIAAGQDRLDLVFTMGAQRLLGRLEKSQQPGRRRRWS